MRWLVLALATACSAAPVRREAPPPADAIFGLWALSDASRTLMRVVAAPGGVTVDAWPRGSSTHFEVSGVTWEGGRLRATFRYPATDVTTTSELLLVNRDRLEGTVSGAYRGRETWLRARDES